MVQHAIILLKAEVKASRSPAARQYGVDIRRHHNSLFRSRILGQYSNTWLRISHRVIMFLSLFHWILFEPADSLLVVKLIGYFPENLFSAGNQVMPGYSEQLVPRQVDTWEKFKNYEHIVGRNSEKIKNRWTTNQQSYSQAFDYINIKWLKVNTNLNTEILLLDERRVLSFLILW